MQKTDHEPIVYNELNLIPITEKNKDIKVPVINYSLYITHHNFIYLLVIYSQRIKKNQISCDE